VRQAVAPEDAPGVVRLPVGVGSRRRSASPEPVTTDHVYVAVLALLARTLACVGI